MGQDRERFALAVFFLESGEILLACGVIPQEEDRRFREGPCERGMANVRARGPVAFAGRFFGTRDQAAVGDKILDAGETRDGMDLIQQDEAQDVANPGHRLEQVYRLGIVRLGGFDDVSLQGAEKMVIVANQRQVHCHAFLDRRVGKPLGDTVAVGFVGQLFPNLGQVVLAVGVLDVRQ
jgi:hypothetical protein